MTTIGRTTSPPERLTPRQREVLELLRRGDTNEEIARSLGISLDGAKWHVSEIIGRLGVSDRYEAARWRPEGERRPWWSLVWLRELRWPAAAKAASAAVGGVVIMAIVALAWGVWSTNDDRASIAAPRTLVVSADERAIAVDTETGSVTPGFGGLAYLAHVISPDGTRAAFPCSDEGHILAIKDSALCTWGSAARPSVVVSSAQLPPGGFLTDEKRLEYRERSPQIAPQIAWSADASKIAFLVYQRAAPDVVSSGDLYVKDLENGDLRLLDRGEFARYRNDLRWSPDGAHISLIDVEASSAVSDRSQVAVRTHLRLINVANAQRNDVSFGTEGELSRYAWSPDSRALAVTAQGSLYVVDITSTASNPRRIGDAWGGDDTGFDALVWSPDGSWIAASELVSGNHVFVTRADGSERRRVDGDLASSSNPVWSHDSRYIAFAGTRPSLDDAPHIYVADTSGGPPREVNDDASPLVWRRVIVAWSADGERVLYTAEPVCDIGCPDGYLFMVSADGSSAPRKLYDQAASEILGWTD